MTSADIPTRYVITLSMAGYMPESDPYVFETDPDMAPMPQLLAYMRDEIDRICDSDWCWSDESADAMAERKAWETVLAEIDGDIEHAADLDESGAIYGLPGSSRLNLEATRYSASQLIGIGYSVDTSAIDWDAAGIVPPEDYRGDDMQDADFTATQAEADAIAVALNFRDAYGLDNSSTIRDDDRKPQRRM